MGESMHSKSDNGAVSAFGKALPAISVLLSLLAISSALELSATRGRLSIPPAYDDVGYFVDGFDLYKIYLDKGLSADLLPILHQHAPLQSVLAMIGNILFGVGPWSAYMANGFLVIGLVLVLLAFTRSLRPISRFAIILYVVSLPLIGNLVTEFRPDFYWGLLCGVAIYLMFDHAFLRGNRMYTYAPAVFVALALLAKPSASPATAALLGFAALLALWLQRPLRLRLLNVGIFILLILVIAAPYFAINVVAIYDYIHATMVEQYDVNKTNAPFLTQALYFSAGYINQLTLSTALWVGIVLFFWNSAFLFLNGRRDDLIRYCYFALVTFLAYLIPTISPVKTPFLGSIFYGAFLFFTVRGLVLAFGTRINPGQRGSPWFNLGQVIGPALLIFMTVMTFRGWPLLSRQDNAVEWTRASDHLTAALEEAVTAMGLHRPAIVFITGAFPVSSADVALFSRWHGVNMEGDGGYYLRTIEQEKEHALRADFVLISQKVIGRYPGSELNPDLLQWTRSSDDFALVTDFTYSDGLHAYLFRKSETVGWAGGTSDGWIDQSGISLKVEANDLARPFLILEGEANYKVLGGEPKPRAVLTTAPGAPGLDLPARLNAKGSTYQIVIDAHAVALPPNQQASIQLTFDRYFVPKVLGINADDRRLVVRTPTKIEMRSSPPVDD